MEARKVTDAKKIVTDPVLLAELGRRGIDSDYVELTADYGKRVKGKSSPYAKFYRDLKSGTKFMLVSQLPMADAEGQLIEAAWAYDEKREVWYSRNNLFKANIAGNSIELTCLSDQPYGAKKSDTVKYSPQLFLDGKEIKPKAVYPDWLEKDPENESYHQNVLEWDYGICKRRLRIIEGRLLGSWVFVKDPGGEVKIRYNQSGDFRLKLGKYAVSDDEELITKEQFHQAIYPLIVSDSATFYPDAHTESTSVDGTAGKVSASLSWANLIAAAGNTHQDGTANNYIIVFQCTTSSGYYSLLYRGIYLFDTSGLPDGVTISAATFSLYGSAKNDSNSYAPNINVYSAAPAANTSLADSDYGCLGSTAFCDNAIAYSGWNTSGYNDFALNAAGLAAISKTGVTKLGVRNANYDVANVAPTWSSGAWASLNGYFAEQGSCYKPKLVVTYTEGEVKTSGDSGGGIELISLRELNIVETGNGIEQSLAAMVMLSSDGGSGSEIGGLLKGLFSQDEGSGSDSVKVLSSKAGHDLRLQSYQGQVSMPHKEVKL